MNDDPRHDGADGPWYGDWFPEPDVGPAPEPDENGQYSAQQLHDWVQCRNMARIETLIGVLGADAVAMLRFPWH